MMIVWLGIILMVLTFVLVAIDVLFIPTAILSLLSLVSYFFFLLYVYFQISKSIAIILFIAFALIGGVGAYFIFRYKWWRVLSNTQTLPKNNALYEPLEDLTGKTAKTISDLRPSGKILLAGKRYDALSQFDFIPKGVLVTVSGTSSSQLLVRPLNL